ncbi:BCD1 [Sanghuangporus weigelae]
MDTIPNQPGPSTPPTQPSCTVCNSQPSKYTCPRCKTKTCSLSCSRAHKSSTGCSGERERTVFVPMNQYGYSALMNDYVFLEEMGRKAEGWGRDILKSGIDRRASGGMRNARGRGMSGSGRPLRGQDRKSILAMQLSVRDIDMDILPVGMKRAGLNKSYWDMKAKRALLTLEFVIRPPPDPLTREVLEPISIVTHRNDWNQTIRQIIRQKFKETKCTKSKEGIQHWLNLDEVDEDIPSSVLCVMKRPRSHDDHLDLTSSRQRYYKLDWDDALSKALRNKHFVEFPTIFLMDEALFDGLLVDDSGIVEDMNERRAKRRKLDPSEAKKTITGLLGGYGSDDEQQNALDTLAEYSGNEQSDAEASALGEDDSSSEADETGDEPPAVPDEEQVADGSTGVGGDDETLDWGDDEVAEDEAKLAELSAVIQQRYSAL